MRVLRELEMPARLENLDRFKRVATECAAQQGFAPARVTEIEVAVEEVVANIVMHGYPNEAGPIRLACGTDADAGFVLEFVDQGVPFDVDTAPAPNLDGDLSERPVGGLGIFLLKNLMDDVRYRREGTRNILTLTASGPGRGK